MPEPDLIDLILRDLRGAMIEGACSLDVWECQENI